MADIDDVLERLVTDVGFRQQVVTDPATALAGYDLDADDVALLARTMDGSDGGQRAVEPRTSKSAMLGLLAPLAGSTAGQRAGGGYNEMAMDDTAGAQRAPEIDGDEKVSAGELSGDGGDAELGHALGLRHEHTRPDSAPAGDFLTIEDA